MHPQLRFFESHALFHRCKLHQTCFKNAFALLTAFSQKSSVENSQNVFCQYQSHTYISYNSLNKIAHLDFSTFCSVTVQNNMYWVVLKVLLNIHLHSQFQYNTNCFKNVHKLFYAVIGPSIPPREGELSFIHYMFHISTTCFQSFCRGRS